MRISDWSSDVCSSDLVRIIPFNAAGRATGCTEISFTTETLLAKPDCAVITAPVDGAEDVGLGAGISWNAVPDASGYRVFIGTTAGGSEVVNGEAVTGTSYELADGFGESTTYYRSEEHTSELQSIMRNSSA